MSDIPSYSIAIIASAIMVAVSVIDKGSGFSETWWKRLKPIVLIFITSALLLVLFGILFSVDLKVLSLSIMFFSTTLLFIYQLMGISTPIKRSMEIIRRYVDEYSDIFKEK